MTLAVRFQPLADTDVMAASAWYENKRDGLGLEFLNEIGRCVALIANNPLPWPILEGSVRYININRFPYRIFFQTESRRMAFSKTKCNAFLL